MGDKNVNLAALREFWRELHAVPRPGEANDINEFLEKVTNPPFTVLTIDLIANTPKEVTEPGFGIRILATSTSNNLVIMSYQKQTTQQGGYALYANRHNGIRSERGWNKFYLCPTTTGTYDFQIMKSRFERELEGGL